jgi:hypothetical protein
MPTANSVERRLQAGGIVLILGFAVEGLSLLGHRPIAFLIFDHAATLLVLASIGAYLLALVRHGGTA